ncbi:hypothetical protein BH09PSE1_BH09PSE1_19970 [soil metagenome]
MAKKSAAARKTLSTANLVELGAERLARLLVEAASGDMNLKRRLKLELAAEVGAADLALEIDKRLTTLAGAKTRVSWRKRPDLIEDLTVHLDAIVDRLAGMDARLAFDRIIGWFDLFPGLTLRVKDPKGELSALFFDAASDLAAMASAAGAEVAGPVLFEALQTRLSEWGGWIGRAAPDLDEALAVDLLERLTKGRARPAGRLALVVRKLADRAGDVQAWADAIPDVEKSRPEVGAEIARRLAAAARVPEARAALESSRPRAPTPSKWALRTGATTPPEPSDAWDTAEIVVLEAEGAMDEAQARRWALFERTLSDFALKAFIGRLADFDDVEALDRGHAVAASWADAARGLGFLMNWPALREAAAMVLARSDDLRLDAEETALWAARLEGRYPNAALLLIRARARMLTRQGLGRSDEVRALSAEAAAMAEAPGALDGVSSHADFIDELEALSSPTGRRSLR